MLACTFCKCVGRSGNGLPPGDVGADTLCKGSSCRAVASVKTPPTSQAAASRAVNAFTAGQRTCSVFRI